MKYPRRSLTLNEEVQHILNEKKGVSSNTTKTVDYIKFLIKDCVSVSQYRENIDDFPNLHFKSFVSSVNPVRDNKNKCNIYKYRFLFPRTAMTSWMSEDSGLDIVCKIYDTNTDLIKDPERIGDAYSLSKKNNVDNKQNIYMYFEICTAYNSNDYFIGDYKVRLFEPNNNDLVSVIQHEMNHVNKRDDTYLLSSEYSKSYNTIINNISNGKTNIIKIIGELLYRYCIPTESEAFTEQFYKQWIAEYKQKYTFTFTRLAKETNRGRVPTDKEREELAEKTKVYQEYLKLQSWLILHKNEIFKYENSKDLYDNYKDSAVYFLKLKYFNHKDNYTEWCEEFIKRIEACLDKFQKRCLRATHIVESEKPLIGELIEEYHERIY